MNILCSSDTYTTAARLAERHAALCREMLSIVFCAPASGMAAARRHGVTDAILAVHPDYWLIWAALKWAASEKRDTIAAVRGAILILKAEAWCGAWTNRKVCALAEAYSAFPSPMQALDVRLCAKRLIECHGAMLTLNRNSRATARAVARVLERRCA